MSPRRRNRDSRSLSEVVRDICFSIREGTNWTDQGLCTSHSPSVSSSPSLSPSASVSPSASPSVSISPSLSPSASVSPSASPSVSISPSVEPTAEWDPGYQNAGGSFAASGIWTGIAAGGGGSGGGWWSNVHGVRGGSGSHYHGPINHRPIRLTEVNILDDIDNSVNTFVSKCTYCELSFTMSEIDIANRKYTFGPDKIPFDVCPKCYKLVNGEKKKFRRIIMGDKHG